MDKQTVFIGHKKTTGRAFAARPVVDFAVILVALSSSRDRNDKGPEISLDFTKEGKP
jgi:hypothetical protein